MKAVLTFDLPEEKQDFRVASRALDWALTIWELDETLRRWIKYGHTFKDVEDALSCIREELGDLMSERGISLEDVE